MHALHDCFDDKLMRLEPAAGAVVKRGNFLGTQGQAQLALQQLAKQGMKTVPATLVVKGNYKQVALPERVEQLLCWQMLWCASHDCVAK